MQLIVVILLLVAIWVVYQIYISYTNIVKELKQIKEKCISSGVSKKEAFIDHLSKNSSEKKVSNLKEGLLGFLKKQLKETS